MQSGMGGRFRSESAADFTGILEVVLEEGCPELPPTPINARKTPQGMLNPEQRPCWRSLAVMGHPTQRD
jgi:hypothetical protein